MGMPASERGKDGCYPEGILLSAACNLKSPPRLVFRAHGDEEQAGQLAQEIHSRFGWDAVVPQYG